MERTTPEIDPLRNAPVSVRLALLSNHAEEIRRNNEVTVRLEAMDKTIRDGLLADQQRAVEALLTQGLSGSELLDAYTTILAEFGDTRAKEYLTELLERRNLLVPGTPFVPREVAKPEPRIIADDPEGPQFVLRVAPDEKTVTPALRILNTEGGYVVSGLRDEIGRDLVKNRLDQMSRGRNSEPTNKQLRRCITYYRLIDDQEGIDFCTSLLARRKAALTVELRQS